MKGFVPAYFITSGHSVKSKKEVHHYPLNE